MTETDKAGSTSATRPLVPVIAYGALFALGLPVLLGLWMWRLDALLQLPALEGHGVGGGLAGLGIALMAAACVSLWNDGRGLPMSPFPPTQLATRGIYALVADPLYVGAVLTCLGAALAVHSGGGLWIVTPVLASAATAFVWGFERSSTVVRLGPRPAPWLHIPGATDATPSVGDRVSVLLLVLLPWWVLYEGVSRLGASEAAWSTYLAWEQQIPVMPWTESLYGLTYMLVVLAVLFV